DADIDWIRASCFEQDLALHAGLAPYHLFRTGAKDRRTKLIHGSKPRGARSRRSGPTRAAARVGPTQICIDTIDSRQTEHARGAHREVRALARAQRLDDLNWPERG